MVVHVVFTNKKILTPTKLVNAAVLSKSRFVFDLQYANPAMTEINTARPSPPTCKKMCTK